ncbi:glyoxylate/hydroxypyruvate reductase HPR3-like [Melia azedarach]|uniref:Glyoxylate/hydroxypyruvate reductase HPR3-like n=1 Tax=Melia azedarach TaxID=155640 RepID=A0ACC1YTL7_MELAZ|nr:glyoxylate/hydroxypyruvate reductase HPR3-like [Melia azedarach]
MLAKILSLWSSSTASFPKIPKPVIMATHQENQSQTRNLPHVLLIRKPAVFDMFGEQPFTSNKFHYLKAYESTLPLDQFLTTHAESAKAIFSSAGAPVTAEILQLLPKVRLVVVTSAGLNHIDVGECHRRGVAVANAGNVFSEDVADCAVGLLIDVLRKISAANRFVRQGLWPVNGEYPLGSKLGGKRVGIVGLGSIGSEVAKRLESFGCCISYNSRKKKPSITYPFYPDVCELAANSDVLIICCGLTHETHHMINKQVLSALGKKGIVINVGRGPIIDEKEMVKCLLQGEIAGAGLDVFENEPDVPKDLFALDNVVLSPHSAVFTAESLKEVCELAVANLEAFFSNLPLLTPVRDD